METMLFAILMLTFIGCKKTSTTDEVISHRGEDTSENKIELETTVSQTVGKTLPPENIETTAPPATEPKFTVPEGAVSLDAEEVAALQALFTQPEMTDGVYPPTNWYNMAMTSFYETPEQLNLALFFCEGAGGEERKYELTEEEQAFLSTQPQISMELDITRVSAQTVEMVLARYFGRCLEEMDGVGMNSMAYFPETDCYYYSKGSTKYVWDFTVTAAYSMEDGTVLMCWEGPYGQKYVMTLMPGGDGYQILSNLWLNMDQFIPKLAQ